MAHLGSDVAAFVDGQLAPASMSAAQTHLHECDACERAVRQQRLLKSRMSTVSTPAPPSDLLAALSGLATRPPEQGWWRRVRRAAPARAGMALAGASLAVAAVAYAVGGGSAGIGDHIAPPFAEYEAAFFGATSTATTASVSDDTIEELTAAGWPCHPRLAGDLERTQTSFARTGNTIALTYTNGTTRLKLYEQTGRLDPSSLDGFVQRSWGGSAVWVREGSPTVVTWDDSGVVFTMVTDADTDRIRHAVSELPAGADQISPAERLSNGLDRMTSWVSAA